MTAFAIGQSRFNRDQACSVSITGPRGSVTIHDEHLSGLFTVRGLGPRQYVEGLEAANALARAMVGLEATS